MSQKPKNQNSIPAARAKSAERIAPGLRPESTSPVVSPSDELEPTALRTSAPVWFFVVLLISIYWAMVHLDQYAGGFNDLVFEPYTSSKQLADLAPKSGPEMMIAKGEGVYAQVCIGCHQASGLGSPGQYPPLAGSEWAQGPANRVIRIPLNGLTGPIQVENHEWNSQMPAFGGLPILEDDENLAALLTYVRQAWGNKAPPIPPAQVKAVRAETASRSSQWTADELLKIE